MTRSDQEDLDGADDVHGRGDGGSEVEQNSDSAAELGPERSRDHEIRSTTGDDAVGRDGTHRHRCCHRLHTHTHIVHWPSTSLPVSPLATPSSVTIGHGHAVLDYVPKSLVTL